MSGVVGWPASHCPSVADYDQASLDVIEKIGNRIKVVAAGGKCSEDCKVNKNYCKEDGDYVNGVTEERVGVGVTESQTA